MFDCAYGLPFTAYTSLYGKGSVNHSELCEEGRLGFGNIGCIERAKDKH